MIRTPPKEARGFVLIMSLLCIFLVTAFLVTFFAILSGGVQQAKRATDKMHAFYVADAGLTYGFTQLRASVNPPLGILSYSSNNYPVGPSLAGSYTVQITNNGAPSWPTYTLVSQGIYGQATVTLTLKAQVTSIAQWNYLSNSEISPTWGALWWVTGMVEVGKVQTNGQFNIFGSPDFDGPVSQTSPTINYFQGGPPLDNPDFQQGITLGADPIAFPSAVMLAPIQAAANIDPRYSLTGNTTIVLNPAGTMTVTNNGSTNTLPMPANQALYVKGGNVNVQGTLKGQLTIGTDTTITITSNILYNTDPRTNPTSTDMLGLVAQGNVIVADGASQGTQGLEIDGYIVSTNGSFQCANYWSGFMGNMVQFGGLANNVCGPTGICDWSGNIIAGYNQLQYYDSRFATTSPPWFPAARSGVDNEIEYSKVSFAET